MKNIEFFLKKDILKKYMADAPLKYWDHYKQRVSKEIAIIKRSLRSEKDQMQCVLLPEILKHKKSVMQKLRASR